MSKIVIYTKSFCPHCVNARQLLRHKGYAFDEIDIGNDPALAIEVAEQSGQRTVPQIFVGPHAVGGYSELVRATSSGAFASLVQQCG